MVESKNTHIPSVVDVITPDDWISMVFHPDASQCIVRDLIVFIDSLEK